MSGFFWVIEDCPAMGWRLFSVIAYVDASYDPTSSKRWLHSRQQIYLQFPRIGAPRLINNA